MYLRTEYKAKALVSRDVPADGSCFFSAIGEILSLSNGEGAQSGAVRRNTNKQLRRMIAEEILENKEKHAGMIMKSEGQSPELYAQTIVHPSMWGGYIDAVILSELLGVSIIILALEPGQGYYFTMCIGEHKHAIAIRFKMNHYNYLTRVDGSVYLRSEDVIAYGDEWQGALEERRKKRALEKPAFKLQLDKDAPPNYSDLSPEKMRTPMLWECPKRTSCKTMDVETLRRARKINASAAVVSAAVASVGGTKPQNKATLNAYYKDRLEFEQELKTLEQELKTLEQEPAPLKPAVKEPAVKEPNEPSSSKDTPRDLTISWV